MRILFFVSLFFLAVGLFATTPPLTSGYALAPKASASPEEKERAYLEARNRVISAAIKYENTPYKYGGMSASGMDCSGFICQSFKDALGVALPRSASGLYSWVEKIPLEKAQPGDLLFFKTDSSGRITHVGLYLGNRRFIHAASVGARTGVIYNSLDDGNWTRNYAGAGRVFPEASPGSFTENISINTGAKNGGNKSGSGGSSSGSGNNSGNSNSNSSGGWGGLEGSGKKPASSDGQGRLLLGVALAPTWNGFLKDGEFLRGFSSQLRLGADTYSLGKRMLFGIELRPEYDGALGVFRLPITFSWGPNDQIRLFAGPVFSWGDATISTENGERRYTGGTSWLGTIGLTAAPFAINTDAGEFAPYLEVAWQSYFSDNAKDNLNADFSAGFRFSTGMRWTIPVTGKKK